MSKFKKISSDAQSTTFRHDNGHTMTIAHKGVSPKFREEMSKMPTEKPQKMAKGGEVDKKLEVEPIAQKNESGLEYEDLAQPEPKNSLEVEPMARGGMAQSNPKLEESKKVPPKMYADGGDVQADKPPVTINIGQQPQIPANMINPQAGQQAAAQMQQSNPQQMTAEQQAASNPGAQPYGVPAGGQDAVSAQAPQAQATQASQEASTISQLPQAQGQASVPPSQSLEDLPGGINGPMGLMSAIGKTEAGITGEAAAQGALGNQQAGIEQGATQQQQNLAAQFQQNLHTIMGERQDLQHDLANAHIDANRYVNSMSTGQHIMTGIGLILGGIGGSGHGNVVMDALQRNIDRDIDSQRADLGKKENLLSLNMQKEGNLRSAMELTRIQTNDMVAHQMQAAAARAQSPLAQANAQKAIGALELQNGLTMQQYAARKSLMQPGSPLQQDPAQYIRFVVPKEEQPAAFKELQELKGTANYRDKALQAFDQAAKLQTLGNKIGSPFQTSSRISAIVDPIVAGLSKETAGRFTESDSKALAPLFPHLTDDANTLAIKRQQIVNQFTPKLQSSVLAGYGLDPSRFTGISQNAPQAVNQQDEILKWARANPNNPKAAKVFQKLGIKQ